MQLDDSDIPDNTDIGEFITQAQVRRALDTDSTTTSFVDLLDLYMTAAMICRALATRAVRKGYLQITTGAGTITRTPQELSALADFYEQEYDKLVNRELTDGEIGITQPLGILNEDMQQTIIDMLHGTTNGLDFEANNYPSIQNLRGGRIA